MIAGQRMKPQLKIVLRYACTEQVDPFDRPLVLPIIIRLSPSASARDAKLCLRS